MNEKEIIMVYEKKGKKSNIDIYILEISTRHRYIYIIDRYLDYYRCIYFFFFLKNMKKKSSLRSLTFNEKNNLFYK